jgi:hypothetical protein
MSKVATQAILKEILARFRRADQGATKDKVVEFALGLQSVLSMHGLPSNLRVLSRTTYGFEGEELFSLPVAHVMVQCQGSEWDVDGADAEGRFIDNWYDCAYERTEFAASTETIESLDELRQNACTPVDVSALQCIVHTLHQAVLAVRSDEIATQAEQVEELCDVMVA